MEKICSEKEKMKTNEKETLTNDSAAYIMDFVPQNFRESRG